MPQCNTMRHHAMPQCHTTQHHMTRHITSCCLVTWHCRYHLEEDPVEVLERDPDLVRRAQDMDQPFEPVYQDEEGNWSAPLLNYREKRTDWQAYIDQTFYKQP